MLYKRVLTCSEIKGCLRHGGARIAAQAPCLVASPSPPPYLHSKHMHHCISKLLIAMSIEMDTIVTLIPQRQDTVRSKDLKPNCQELLMLAELGMRIDERT